MIAIFNMVINNTENSPGTSCLNDVAIKIKAKLTQQFSTAHQHYMICGILTGILHIKIDDHDVCE